MKLEETLLPATTEAMIDWLIKYKGCKWDDSTRGNVLSNFEEHINRRIIQDRTIRPTVIVHNHFSLFGSSK